jgi:septal ring factor EnvC (AmiA/AmiB activator)
LRSDGSDQVRPSFSVERHVDPEFLQRHVAVVILFTFVSVSGCAYLNAMNHEVKKGNILAETIKRENDRKNLLDKNKKGLEEDIVNLKKEINKQDRQLGELRAEIAMLQQKKDKVDSDIKQIQRGNAKVERLKAEIKKKKEDVTRKKNELESFSY